MRRFTQVSLLGAIAFSLMYFEFPLPFFPTFLKYDPGDVPALIATFALGPLAGIAVELVKALLIQLLRSAPLGGPFGIFMNLLAGVTLVGVAGWYYRIEHTRTGAVKALLLGVVTTSVVMVAANIVLTPIFFGLPRAQVLTLVLPALLPFNLIKGTANALVTFYVYKRVRLYLFERVSDRAVW